jgi:uncharacterized protein YbaP (TraB family)
MLRICCVLLVIFAPVAGAETSLWKVSKGDRVLMIGGTLHMLSERDYPLPQEFEQAYRRADSLVLESDIGATNSPAFQNELAQKLTYPEGQSLRQHLSKEAYQALEAHCKSRGISVTALDQFKPPLIAISLSVLELQRMGMTAVGVDNYFYSRAHADRKSVVGLESAAQQLDFLVNMGAGRDDELILSTIQEMETAASVMAQVKSAWRGGDEQLLEAAALAPLRADFPDIYQTLVVQRNEDWLGQIEKMLGTREVELILVGAAHLVGNQGLLDELRERGYRVEPFSGS